MVDLTAKTVREILVESPTTTEIFEEFKIDYCCGGDRLFADACQAAGVEPPIVADKIEEALAKPDGGIELPERKNASDLIKYIIDKHHVFTREQIVRLSALMERVCGKHLQQHAELGDLRQAFATLCNDLVFHLKKEETVLFPYIMELEKARIESRPATAAPFGSVNDSARSLRWEHEEASNILRKMRRISFEYALPEDACPSFQALYFGLQELEKDLHQHIHLENNVLFPLAAKMEGETAFGD
ncbi:MAG: iron-sulfur cluster repair di-iron protein [Pyrinomonadaceae bacterium]